MYLFKYEGKIFALTGSKPTEKALSEIKGLTKYSNILRKEPQKFSEYCNHDSRGYTKSRRYYIKIKGLSLTRQKQVKSPQI